MQDNQFRPGDVETPFGTLRLTLGALAEITERLEAENPQALASEIRAITPAKSRILLRALLRPCGGEERLNGLPDTEVAALMPSATQCIVRALEPGV